MTRFFSWFFFFLSLCCIHVIYFNDDDDDEYATSINYRLVSRNSSVLHCNIVNIMYLVFMNVSSQDNFWVSDDDDDYKSFFFLWHISLSLSYLWITFTQHIKQQQQRLTHSKYENQKSSTKTKNRIYLTGQTRRNSRERKQKLE